MAAEDVSKTTFRCLGFVGLFKWIVMTFGLKNAGATYQRAMNLIFHELLGIRVEAYIDDVVVMSAGFDSLMSDLHVAFERMQKYMLRMNLLKCVFGVTIGHFLGFVVHENGIEIDPKKIENVRRIKEPTNRTEVQSLLRKVNYLR
jgi:acetoin utilization deacetylase AcuC-like enzyme